MQILKDNIKKAILDAAEKEFLEKGFGDAALLHNASTVAISMGAMRRID